MRKSRMKRREPRGPIRWTLSNEEKKIVEAHNNWVIARKNGKKTKRYRMKTL